jgi:hypothetical protein
VFVREAAVDEASGSGVIKRSVSGSLELLTKYLQQLVEDIKIIIADDKHKHSIEY